MSIESTPLESAQAFDFDELRFNELGLIPAIVIESTSREVLMMAWMNRESLELTITSGRTWFYSRSREELWPKGETSGDVQLVRHIRADCDLDTLLVEVDQKGSGACHTGAYSCFFNLVADRPGTDA